MRTVKRNPFLSGVCAVLGGVFLWAGVAGADVTSDRAAAILVLPKLVYDSNGRYSPNLKPTDTEVQVTNVSNHEVSLRCFYVNANAHCSNAPGEVCFARSDCDVFGGGFCLEGWIETDFTFTLSPRQPVVWRISQGLTALPLADTGQNSGSVPAVNEDPFRGELKCVEVGPDDEPVAQNDLKAEATIVAASSSGIDARGYNGLGIQAIELEGSNNGDNTLVLGGEEPEYNGCPSVLILDHFFDDAVEPIDGDQVKTHLTCVPCSQNFVLQDVALFDTTLQFLVFNEFEQRFSSSRSLRCFHEYELCSLDGKWDRPIGEYNPNYQSCQRSIFSAYVSGTLTGQTRIRGVESDDTEHGHGVLCVAEEFFRPGFTTLLDTRSSDAFNIHQVGVRTKADIIQLP